MSIFFQRVRHELKRRTLIIKEIISLTPKMLRIVFESDDMVDFPSLSPDDHIKLFFGDEMRDYTPRTFDKIAKTLTIDFALHENGIATNWARNAKIGDELTIGGPKGSSIITGSPEWWLLIGDETAIPAIARRLEEMPKDYKVTIFITITSDAEKQNFIMPKDAIINWIIRPECENSNPASLLDAVSKFNYPNQNGFIWIAAEAKIARAIRDYFQTNHNHPSRMLQAKGYWVKGIANAVEKLD